MEFLLLFIIANATLLAIVGVFHWLRVRNKYPRRSALSIRYEESGVSGYSHRSTATKLGGAKNCLRVTVTNDHLLVFPVFPFSLLGSRSDLEHTIPLERIRGISERAGEVDVEFEDGQNSIGRLTLRLSNPHKLVSLINDNTQDVAHNNALVQ